MVHLVKRTVRTAGQGDTHDLTPQVNETIGASGMKSGAATISVIGSTASVTTIECEPGAVADLGRALEQIAPRHGRYDHHLQWGDDNGSSHVRAALMGPSVTLPFYEGALVTGTWQQVVLVEWDTRPRSRQFAILLVGE